MDGSIVPRDDTAISRNVPVEILNAAASRSASPGHTLPTHHETIVWMQCTQIVCNSAMTPRLCECIDPCGETNIDVADRVADVRKNSC